MSAAETEQKNLLDHDVKAQIVNITGFCQEIESIIGEFNSLYLSEVDASEKLEVLLHEDLLPCSEFLALSAKKLAEISKGMSKHSLQGN